MIPLCCDWGSSHTQNDYPIHICICNVIGSLQMHLMGISIITPYLSFQMLKVSWDPSWLLMGNSCYHYAMVEAQATPRLAPISTWIMYKVFDNLYLLLMGMWMHHQTITTTLVSSYLECELKFLVTDGVWMILLCCDWCSSAAQICIHIHLNHIKGVWQPSYAVDGHLDLSSLLYHHTCWLIVVTLAEIPPGKYWARNDTVLLSLRLKLHPE